MSAVIARLDRLKANDRAVLVRNGVTFKGTLFQVPATPASDDAYWMLHVVKGSAALAIRPGDELWVSDPSPCFGCAVKTIRLTRTCWYCFDRFL